MLDLRFLLSELLRRPAARARWGISSVGVLAVSLKSWKVSANLRFMDEEGWEGLEGALCGVPEEEDEADADPELAEEERERGRR